MASLILTLALASTVLAHDSSNQTPSSSELPSTTSLLLPFYPPYPISSIDPSSPSSSQGPAETTTPLDYYWQHEYRDYYASIITVVSTSTLVYAIDCAPNSRHPSYSLPDFNSTLVCASTVVGAGPITVTQGPEQWAFAATQAVREFNRSTTATEMNTWGVTCGALSEKTKTCTYVNEWEDGEASTLVVPSGRVGSAAIDGFQDYFTTMSEVLVTVTGGVEKIPASVLSSLEDDATGVVSLVTSLSPDQSSNEPAGVSSSTGAAPRVTGVVAKEALFGAAGVLGAAVFGL